MTKINLHVFFTKLAYNDKNESKEWDMKNALTVLRRKNGIETAEAMAEKLGMPVWTYRNYENGKTPLTLDLAWRIADILHCSIDEVGGYAESSEPDAVKVEFLEEDSHYIYLPILGDIAAGKPIEVMQTGLTYPIPKEITEMYPNDDLVLVRIDGESMNNILPNRALALVRLCDTVEHDGKPYALYVNGYDMTIKRVFTLENGFKLVPDSNDPTFHEEVFDYSKEGTESIKIAGEVVWMAMPFDWSF